jgi:hypothetical protein
MNSRLRYLMLLSVVLVAVPSFAQWGAPDAGGTITYTHNGNSIVQVLSNNASAYAGYNLGRMGQDGILAVASSAGQFAVTAQPGDVVFRGTTANFIFNVFNGSGSLFFNTGNPDTTKMVLTNSGNVGIGTLNPQALLHVAGGVMVDGNIAAKYQDVAEWVPANASIKPGTVVVLNKEHSNEVMASSRAYDTAVAGVVSETPGLILGEASPEKCKVATTGRVRVKVDAGKTGISVGDLLVTGDGAGIAIKSVPVNIGGIEMHRPGTILGKALEPLPSGQGEILVLLTLQ